MNIIILGAGEIGMFMAQQLSEKQHNICLIEADESVAAAASETLDVRVVQGNGASISLLEEAGVAECDVFMGLTSHDNTNLVSASIARPLGAKKSVARVHAEMQQEQWLLDFRDHFHIDHLFSPERLAAVELAKFIRNPDCLAVEEIARGRIELQQSRVFATSPAAGKSLLQLGLPQRVRVGSIQRQGHIFIPDASEIIKPDDVVTLFGATHSLDSVSALFRSRAASQRQPKVVIFGGGAYGLALAQMLEGGKFQVRLLEKDARRCQQLARTLSRATVLAMDATSMAELREEQIGDADFFVAATPDDEDNVMTCLQAHDLGVWHCLTLIHRADYADAVMRASARLGILGAVSPRVATSRELVKFTASGSANTLATLDGGLEVMEFTVQESSLVRGSTIAATQWPRGSILVSVTRGSAAYVPAADDVLEAGDVVVAMVAPSAWREFQRLIH